MYSPPAYPGPVVLPRVGVPLPPPEISGRYYYSRGEEFVATSPPLCVKSSSSSSSPFPKSVSVPLLDLGPAGDEIFDEPTPARVRQSVGHKCLSRRREW
mmetsp:Transcript_19993/g.19752  ORF Transcript_19993/g.19752 Transcript_19993/m.19752 type:complete len:99 (-) Transcript_19993:10-306(-)